MLNSVIIDRSYIIKLLYLTRKADGSDADIQMHWWWWLLTARDKWYIGTKYRDVGLPALLIMQQEAIIKQWI